MNSLIRLDDRDPAVSYLHPSSQWLQLGNPSLEFHGTTTLPTARGATASFVFSGTSVEVYGTVNPSVANTTVQYSIDDQIISSNMNYSSHGTVLYQQLLFQSSGFSPAPNHTLTIEFTNEKPDGIFLDYFQYAPDSGSGVTATSTVTLPRSTLALTSTVTVASPLSSTRADSGCRGGRFRIFGAVALVYTIITMSLL